MAVDPGLAHGAELAMLRFMHSTLVQGGDANALIAQAVGAAPAPAPAAAPAAPAQDDVDVTEL